MRKASYCLTSLLTLIVFANYDGIDSCSKISEYCIYNILYKYVCDDIQPSEHILQRFKHSESNRKKNNVETRTGYKIAGYNLRRLENIMKNDNKNRDKILDLIKKNYKRKYLYKNFNIFY